MYATTYNMQPHALAISVATRYALSGESRGLFEGGGCTMLPGKKRKMMLENINVHSYNYRKSCESISEYGA